MVVRWGVWGGGVVGEGGKEGEDFWVDYSLDSWLRAREVVRVDC